MLVLVVCGKKANSLVKNGHVIMNIKTCDGSQNKKGISKMRPRCQKKVCFDFDITRFQWQGLCNMKLPKKHWETMAQSKFLAWEKRGPTTFLRDVK